MGVTTTKRKTFENGFRNVQDTSGHMSFQVEDEIMKVGDKRPSVVLNGDSRGSHQNRSLHESRRQKKFGEVDRATENPQYHTPSYVPPVYPVSSDKCSNCMFAKSFCYVRDQHSCNEYVQCFKEVGGDVRAYARKCAFGFFWDSNYNVCGRSTEISCDADPCGDGLLESYPYIDNCAAYWRCEKARSVAGCCAEGHAYVEGSGCLPDVSCVSKCYRTTNYGVHERKVMDKVCHLKPFPVDRRYYLEFVPGHGMRPRPCSAGTIYNHTMCQCVAGFSEVTKCEPELLLDFNYQIVDRSRNGLPLTVSGVNSQRGAGVFNNDSQIIFWRFSGAHIGSKLTIHIKFKDTGSLMNRIEYLISNCYLSNYKKTSSVALALNRRTSEVLMLVDTNKSEPTVLRLKYTPNHWQDATLTYNGEMFQAQLGQSASEKVTLQGEIEPRPSGFVLGNCGNFPSFTGLIKEVHIYLCNP